MYLMLGGILLVSIVIGLFWAKDRLHSPLLARVAYSGLIARLAVLGAVFTLLGLLMVIADLIDS